MVKKFKTKQYFWKENKSKNCNKFYAHNQIYVIIIIMVKNFKQKIFCRKTSQKL